MDHEGAFITPDTGRATLEDVARAAGVSPATVSRYINNPTIVSSARSSQIQQAIESLNYVPHGAARSLASRRSRMIGAVFPSLESTLFGGALETLQSEVAAAGYTLVVASSGYDPQREREHIHNLLASGVDALMLVGDARDAEVYDLIQRERVPFVLTWVSRAKGGHPCVGFDNEAAGSLVTRHLLDMGHRQIAVITGPQQNNDRAAARIAGVKAALQRNGLVLDPRYLVESPFGVSEGRAALRLLMTRQPRPTAVVCGAEPFAYGAMFECQALGIRIPKDLSITGFDDMWLAAEISPGLTTVRTPRRQMGSLAGRYLLSVLAGQETPMPRPLDFELVVRGSSAPPPVNS